MRGRTRDSSDIDPDLVAGLAWWMPPLFMRVCVLSRSIDVK